MNATLDILIRLDITAFRAHCEREHGFGPSSDEVALVAMHKARCERSDVPAELRNESSCWLLKRGYYAGRRPVQ